ncbi:MAG: HNH endonuclease [Rhodobacteraceae bacterium]|nr:HNH endonuclease [Paracoccaceae bacterium]MBR28827.1 HNH endonuclease [Paracoccaceae bacterium]
MAKWPYTTAAWARLRAAKLGATPLCEPCRRVGKLTAASVVDHKHAINLGGPAFPALDGLASMCPSCHSIKTNREDRPQMAPPKGCDASGAPLDPFHPYHSDAPAGGPSIASRHTGDQRPKVANIVSSTRAGGRR